MNDRFKFRVWCCNKKEWETDEIMISNKDKYFITYSDIKKPFLITDVDPEYHEINFCTGLKDKNGKLIYDGDIVKINADLYQDLYEEFFDEYAVVSYDETKACWVFAYKPRDNSGDNIFSLICDYYYFLKWSPVGDLPYNTLAYVEIIGNIYENGELLCQE